MREKHKRDQTGRKKLVKKQQLKLIKKKSINLNKKKKIKRKNRPL
jgi:hypothetical protein